MHSLHSLTIAVIAFIVGILLGVTLFRGRPVDPVVIARVDTVLADGPAARAVRDSLRAAVHQLAADTAQRARLDQSAARQADSIAALRAALDSARTPADSIATLTTTVVVLTQHAISLDSLYQGERRRAALLLVASDSLGRAGEARIERLERELTTARAALAGARTPSRWSFGITGGYAAVHDNGKVRTGAGATVGLTYRPF